MTNVTHMDIKKEQREVMDKAIKKIGRQRTTLAIGRAIATFVALFIIAFVVAAACILAWRVFG